MSQENDDTLSLNEKEIRRQFREHHSRFGRSTAFADAEAKHWIEDYRAFISNGAIGTFVSSRRDLPLSQSGPASLYQVVFPSDIEEAKQSVGDGEGIQVGPHDTLRMIQWFIAHVEQGIPIEHEVLQAISEKFARVLVGFPWQNEFDLPGVELLPRSREERNISLCFRIWELVAYDGEKPTPAIDKAAQEHNMDFYAARAVYRKSEIKKRLERLQDRIKENKKTREF